MQVIFYITLPTYFGLSYLLNIRVFKSTLGKNNYCSYTMNLMDKFSLMQWGTVFSHLITYGRLIL